MKKINYTKAVGDINRTLLLYFCNLESGEIKSLEDFMAAGDLENLKGLIEFEYTEIFDAKELKNVSIPTAQKYTVVYNENKYVPLINIITMSETDNTMVYHRYIYEKKNSDVLDEHIVNLLEKSSRKFVQSKETSTEENIMIPGLKYYFSVVIDRDKEIIKKYLDGTIQEYASDNL